MFKVEFTKSFLKDFKKIPREVQKDVVEKWIPRMQNASTVSGKRFKGGHLCDYWRLAFRYKKNDYRIVYQIHFQKVLILLLAIGSRENFYKKLKRRF